MIDDPEPQRAAPVAMSTRVSSSVLVLGAMGFAAPLVAFGQAWALLPRVAMLCVVMFLLAVAGVSLDTRPVQPVPMATAPGRVRAKVAAWVLTLAGPDAEGPLKRFGRWLTPTQAGA